MKVLAVVPRLIHPGVSGGEIRIGSLMRHLAGRYRFSVATFYEPGDEVRQTAAALECERRLGVRTHFVRRSAPGPGGAWSRPEIAASHYDPAMGPALRGLIAREGFDIIHLEFTQMLQYASSVRDLAPVVATEHDASLVSWGRSYVRDDPRRGFFSAGVGWVRRVLYLRRSLRYCDRVVAVSEADARRLGALVPEERIAVVPTGVDLARFPFAGLDAREPGTAVFVGHYPHFPNEDAAVRLCREVLPALKLRSPGAKVRLVGSAPTAAVRGLAAGDVEVVGTVDDVAPYLASARVFVAPLRLGYGIKGKLLEAFASGTPVAATPQACEAMPGLRGGEHLLVADDPRGLAEAAARLMADDAAASRLAAAARRYVEERFGWERQAALMDRVYGDALAARGRRARFHFPPSRPRACEGLFRPGRGR